MSASASAQTSARARARARGSPRACRAAQRGHRHSPRDLSGRISSYDGSSTRSAAASCLGAPRRAPRRALRRRICGDRCGPGCGVIRPWVTGAARRRRRRWPGARRQSVGAVVVIASPALVIDCGTAFHAILIAAADRACRVMLVFSLRTFGLRLLAPLQRPPLSEPVLLALALLLRVPPPLPAALLPAAALVGDARTDEGIARESREQLLSEPFRHRAVTRPSHVGTSSSCARSPGAALCSSSSTSRVRSTGTPVTALTVQRRWCPRPYRRGRGRAGTGRD